MVHEAGDWKDYLFARLQHPYGLLQGASRRTRR